MVASRQLLEAPDVRQLRDDLDLSRERMARLLGVSAKTVERWENSGRLPASARQRQDLAQISEIVALGRRVFTPAGFVRFLKAPLPVFGGGTALQMIERGRAVDVIASLAGDYEGAGYQVALDDFLTVWRGVAYRHLPAGAPLGVLDFRYAGRSNENRWNVAGEPTLYLASDVGVAIAEFGRHFQRDRAPLTAVDVATRRLYCLDLRIEYLLDLRDPALHTALSLRDFPVCFLDRTIARATAQYLRRVTSAQAILTPSVAMLDQPDHWNLVVFLEKLPADPKQFVQRVTVAGTLQWAHDADD